eukprot:5193060-Pyramimonas_sp.AAC.1
MRVGALERERAAAAHNSSTAVLRHACNSRCVLARPSHQVIHSRQALMCDCGDHVRVDVSKMQQAAVHGVSGRLHGLKKAHNACSSLAVPSVHLPRLQHQRLLPRHAPPSRLG